MRLRKKHFALPELEENKKVFLHPEENKGSWAEVFKNNNPIHLELGAGRGGFALRMAERNPAINFLALDLEANVFVYAGRLIKEADLDNLFGILARAENLCDYFAKGEISKIYINFCNPWPKPRQHKRRLTHPRLLEVYKNILRPGSEIEVKTDDEDLYLASLEYFKDSGFEVFEATDDLEEREDSILTDYEKKWRSQGIKIKYIKAKFIG